MFKNMGIAGKVAIPGLMLAFLVSGLMFFVINNLQRDTAVAQAEKTAMALATQIAGDRAVYTSAVVGKMKRDGIPIEALVNFEQKHGGIPLPATFVHLVSDLVNKQGTLYTVDLMSTDAVNKSKQPQAGTWEYDALATMSKNDTVKSHLNEESLLFTAVTPDFASAQSCVDCHNELAVHKSQINLGDVLGGLVIKIPLQHELNDAKSKAMKLTAGLFASFLALLALQWVIVNRPLIQAITDLEAAADRVSRGDVDTPITSDRGDEIGRLTKAFDRMRASVAAAMQAVGGGGMEDEDGL